MYVTVPIPFKLSLTRTPILFPPESLSETGVIGSVSLSPPRSTSISYFLYSLAIISFISAVFLTSTPFILSITSPACMPASPAGEHVPLSLKTSHSPTTSTFVVPRTKPAGKPPRYSPSPESANTAVGAQTSARTSAARNNIIALNDFFL